MHDHQFHYSEWIPARLIKGYQIASGQNPDTPFGQGSLVLQLPLFCDQGLPFQNIHAATLNLKIEPRTFAWKRPWKTLSSLQWHPDFPPESFYFCPCKFKHDNNLYSGFVYYPLPEQKIGHFHDESVLEIISQFIPGLHYRDRIQLCVPEHYIDIKHG